MLTLGESILELTIIYGHIYTATETETQMRDKEN